MSTTELQQRYLELTRSRADRRWKDSTLAEKIAEVEEQQRKAAEDNVRLEREQEIAEEMRQSRIAARGPFEDFAKNFRRSERDDYAHLARAVGHAQRTIEQHEKVTTDLAEKFAKDPTYTMSWSMGYFDHAAKYRVAMDLKAMFEGGATVDGMITSLNRDIRHKAAYPARSTSPVSNLVEQDLLAAMVKMVGYLDGTEFF